jgi:hypothetical protein
MNPYLARNDEIILAEREDKNINYKVIYNQQEAPTD